MLNKCIGVIDVKTKSDCFGVITQNRPAYMLPFGGRYRLIDFLMSNLVNHGVGTVAVYTGPKVRSVMDHIGTGKPWELSRRKSGLYIFTPHYKDGNNEIQEYYDTLDFYVNAREEYVLLMTKTVISQINLTKAYNEFIESDADVTLIYTDMEHDDSTHNSTSLNLDDEGNFLNVGVNLGSKDRFNFFNGAGFIKKSVFIDLVKLAVEQSEDSTLLEVLVRLKDDLKITVFENKAYTLDVKNIKNYYLSNMKLLDIDLFEKVFFQGGTIFTTTKDEPPTFYGKESHIKDSLIANGCVIEGEVFNSIIFRGVKVAKGAKVKDSIIMQKSIISEGVVIDNAILDKAAFIGEGVMIAGTKANPYLVGKGVNIRKA